MAERIEHLEQRTANLVKSYDAALAAGTDSHHHPNTSSSSNTETPGVVHEDYDAGSDDEMDHDIEDDGSQDFDEEFKDLEEEVATIVADVHDLALYTKLNFTGFVKIVKVSLTAKGGLRLLSTGRGRLKVESFSRLIET